MAKRSSFEKALVGPAAEHFVMYRVHRLGRLAALAPRNLPYADVMIVGEDGSASALVQVKARTTGRDGGWHMSEKHETIVFDRLFYCFVDLEPATPLTYVIPSHLVARVVRDEHRVWLRSLPLIMSRHHLTLRLFGNSGMVDDSVSEAFDAHVLNSRDAFLASSR